MQHEPECQKLMDERFQAIADWKARWPKHCTSCNGTGLRSRAELSDDEEPCPDCVGSGKCGRCAVQLDQCECGWDDSMPGEPECTCVGF